MVARRAYHFYATSAGIHRVRQQLQSKFNSAASQAVSADELVSEDEWGSNQQNDLIVRIPGTPSASVRTRGDRILDEIPPRELAALMGSILTETPFDAEPLFRRVLQAYDIGKLTTKARGILEFAYTICLQQTDS